MPIHVDRRIPLRGRFFILSFAVASNAVSAAPVDAARVLKAADTPTEWVTHGGTYAEQRFSGLKKIDANNVKDLALAWYFDLDTNRGQEATPLVIDGTMYFTSAWSKAFAIDARTGKEKWRFDPQVAAEKNADACCDVVNRGMAAWGDRVFYGTLDGRLIALERATGKVAWSVQTTDPKARYTITGAPRVVRGKVLIGNGGGEMGVRGYISAYDAATGKQAWRFYTVPGNPKDGFENKAMERAAATWAGEWWQFGGGGTVWDSMAYDPQLDLLYIGVGNGSPWNYQARSKGQGDNLYLSSIVALKPDTGEYVWHFQTTPGESWDYTATQHIILADLDIAGVKRKVLMQAPKNGFFYVIDRRTGQFISANNYVNVSWTTGLDPVTGRPKIVPEALFVKEPALVAPSALGGHNWQPMSFSPQTLLAYIPSLQASMPYAQDPAFQMRERGWNTGVGFGGAPNPATVTAASKSKGTSALLAWDPVAQREVWRVDYPRGGNGGLLSTASNLLFQGSADGFFNAYAADTGMKLWSYPTQDAPMGGPVTFELDGEQYVAVITGLGGAAAGGGRGQVGPAMPRAAHGRMLAFKVGGTAHLPPLDASNKKQVPDLSRANATGNATAGRARYDQICASCHGMEAISTTAMPDLRYAPSLIDAVAFKAIVLEGTRQDKGMVSFATVLNAQDAEAIRAYLVSRAAAVTR